MAFVPDRDGLAGDDDRLIEKRGGGRPRWNTILVWFMRLMAILWLVKGILSWSAILGIGVHAQPFETRVVGYQAATVYFAVIDLVAAIGLWLTSTWGGILWLLAVVSHLILAVFFPRFLSSGSLVIGILIGSLMLYLIASWLAAAEE